MRICMKMTGYTQGMPGYSGDVTRRHYECYVAYRSHRDHTKLIKEYLKWYCDYDMDADPTPHFELLDDYNCVRALTTYYFRDSGVRFEHERHEYVAEAGLPQTPANQHADTHDLWAVELKCEEIKTAASAAHFLYDATYSGKIPVDVARAMVASEFPGCFFSWREVLREFSKLGGAYTDKYLRRP